MLTLVGAVLIDDLAYDGDADNGDRFDKPLRSSSRNARSDTSAENDILGSTGRRFEETSWKNQEVFGL